MSRSALWRQEVNVKERDRLAIETFRSVVDEGRYCHVKGQIPLIGPDDTFNINPMLLHNISKSPYFLKCCNHLKDWASLVDEIYYEVKHMEPWTKGASRIPSTAFCLMVRLFTLRCTEKQMALMLNHPDSPYIRCIGFLYLRYATEPSALYSWYEPYLYDEEPVRVSPSAAAPEITIGEYARSLLMEMDYYGTLLPRLPVAIERDLKVRLLQLEKIEARALDHLKNTDFMDYCQTLGCQIRALYGDEENPTTWYNCVVDRVIKRDDETGMEYARPKFVVTFPEYGNTEIVSLGEIDRRTDERHNDHRRNDNLYNNRKPDRREAYGNYQNNERERNWNRRSRYNEDYNERDRRHRDVRGYPDDRGCRFNNINDRHKYSTSRDSHDDNWKRDKYQDRHSRSRSRSREREDKPSLGNNPNDDLMEEVLRREREKSTATGRAYARQPLTFKSSLSVNQGGRSSDNTNSWKDQNAYERDRNGDRNREKGNLAKSKSGSKNVNGDDDVDGSSNMKTPEEIAAIEEKKRKLLAKYG